ncbi:DUF421 domain-containing protein [Bacillus pinisoli]|uniref:DUF421 domain-containing protein n=1 Tax=Bacillus pinisoli TaxID=2901866 RepID=UPI001FF2059C|nr:YetF domain-containing protein [Bacillus pinisoli]
MAAWLQAIIYLAATIILLRLAGKRTLSQATPGEVVIMIGIGTVLVHPLKSTDTWISVYHGALIVVGIILVSLFQIYIPKLNKYIMGEPILLVKDGQVLHHNLKRARIPEDELKMKLRVKKINDITKLKSATLEVSGDIGVEFNEQQAYATKKDIEDLKKAIDLIGSKLGSQALLYSSQSNVNQNLFHQVEEVKERDPLQ